MYDVRTTYPSNKQAVLLRLFFFAHAFTRPFRETQSSACVQSAQASGVVDEDAFARLSGTVSLPFPEGEHKRIAVKVIDPRGNEVLRVHRLGKEYGNTRE
jgi:hypothetical protein